MSITRRAIILVFASLAFQGQANPLAKTDAPVSIPGLRLDISDSEFCRKTRHDRENNIGKEPDLTLDTPVHVRDSAMCFSPGENLFFVANQEAQKILGPHAPWYLQISSEFRGRVKEACNIMGYENDEISRAYDHCIENRYEELMGPYEDKYRREAGNYVRKRRQVAESLVVRCDASLSIKRSRLPKELRFPVAYFDPKVSSVPGWLLEEKLGDPDWLEKISKLKVNDIMHDVLGKDCPGDMVFWVTYNAPGL